MDTLTPEQRSQQMKKVKGKNTKPELIVRRMLYRLGYRFRIHRKDLPAKPDIVLPRHKAVILVNGCFWHGHKLAGCPGARMPKSNVAFWTSKINSNMARDRKNVVALQATGWRVQVIWECETKNLDQLEATLLKFLCK